MLKRSLWTGLWVISALTLAACAPEEGAEEVVGESTWANTSINGIGVNGIGVNGIGVNGTAVNGIGVNGTQLGNTTMSGGALVGTRLPAYLANGSTIWFRIEDAVQTVYNYGDGDPYADNILWLYNVAYENGANWEPVCGYNEQGDVRPAIAFSGVWDYTVDSETNGDTGGDWSPSSTAFTLACDDSTLAKCLKFGYKPWINVPSECAAGAGCPQLSRRDLLQACVRMTRADYCGDGKSHTENGVEINVWDNFGLEYPAPAAASWPNDAEWSPDGALCISNYRRDATATAAYVLEYCPERVSPQAQQKCFTSDSTFFTANGATIDPSQRSLIRNQFKPPSP